MFSCPIKICYTTTHEVSQKAQVEFVQGEFKNPIKGQVREPSQVFSIFKDIKDYTKETLLGVYLNDSLEVNSYEVHSVGGGSYTVIVPDEIFRSAILTNSHNFILIHNHPSGKALPSEADMDMIRMLKEQSLVMNRCFVDFIIVGDEDYWSMFEHLDGGGDYGV